MTYKHLKRAVRPLLLTDMMRAWMMCKTRFTRGICLKETKGYSRAVIRPDDAPPVRPYF